MVSAGTACFGQWITTDKYYFNAANRKCEKFDYFGCSGNSNNFRSKHICEQNCIPQANNGYILFFSFFESRGKMSFV